ncbi:bilin-binding protein-like isoform X2 [Vanessa cardui]|uniref:bilin-binding protein-like isoform X2 n=1 Tax=Vanessa cardui TaxID=171605 RepID=UPI001F130DD5|nr:bilin-binding protein-like isoform X2 [Vanessa cardui]
MYRFTLLSFLASVSAYVITDSKCPEFTNVANFDFKSYGNGVWYEIGRYPDDLVKTGKCGALEYKRVGDITKSKYTYVDKNKLMAIEGTARLAPDAGNTGKLIQQLHFGANGALVESDLSVLTIDYDNFFVDYYCQYDEAKKNSRESAWIGTRSKTLSKETKAAIDKFINESKFLNASKFEWPSFSDEDCRVDA